MYASISSSSWRVSTISDPFMYCPDALLQIFIYLLTYSGTKSGTLTSLFMIVERNIPDLDFIISLAQW